MWCYSRNFHLQYQIDEYTARGMTPEDARAAGVAVGWAAWNRSRRMPQNA
jgi:hypothetical protein